MNSAQDGRAHGHRMNEIFYIIFIDLYVSFTCMSIGQVSLEFHAESALT